MKVLLVVKTKKMESLGVMYLAAVIKQAGHDARITSLDEADCALIHYEPDIVGYSIMTGDMWKFRMFDERYKNGTTTTKKFHSLVGGPDPTFFPKGYEWADVIPGEAEQSIADLLQSGLKYPDIDAIPWPDRTDFPDMKIRDFISSRGCPYNCSYCYNDMWAHITNEPRVRTRNVRDVVKEVYDVNPEFAYFQDSCFGVNLQWFRDFCYIFPREVNVPFHCHMRPNQVDEEHAKLLHMAGCESIRIALESASTRIRKMLHRGSIDLDMVRNAVRYLQNNNVDVMIQNMLACPTSTIEDDLATLEFNIRAKPSYAWSSIFAPYPGTRLGDQCIQEGWFKGDYDKISDSFFDRSVLEFSEEYKTQTYLLQKIFHMCVEIGYLPEPKELTMENFPYLVHKILRKQGDGRLYGGVI